MGVDTRGYLKGYVKPKDILNYIKQKYDINAYMNIRADDYGAKKEFYFIKESYDNSDKWLSENGFIVFYDGSDQRMLFIYMRILTPMRI